MSVQITPVLKGQDPMLLHRRGAEPDSEGLYLVDYAPGFFSEYDVVTIVYYEIETLTGKRRFGLGAGAGIRVGPGDTLRYMFKLGNP